MLGATLALVSAAFFGLNNATVRRGILKSTVLQGMAITVPLGVPVFIGIALFFGGFDAMKSWCLDSWVWMSSAGVVHFVLGRYGNYRATQALGGTLSTPVQQLSILVALVLAFIFLDENVNWLNVLGIVLIMAGPMVLMNRRKSAIAASKSKGFEPQFGPGIFWGGICALGYGVSPLLVVLGLGDTRDFANGIAGVLVSYSAATVVVIGLVILAGGRNYMATLNKASSGWFLISAIVVAMSQLFRYLALAIAPVTIVVPIQRLSVVFRIFFNALLNRDHEVLDGWVIFSIFLAVIGAVALTADSSVLLGFAGLSGDLKTWLVHPLF